MRRVARPFLSAGPPIDWQRAPRCSTAFLPRSIAALLLCGTIVATSEAQLPAASRRATVVVLSALYTGNALLGAHLTIRDLLQAGVTGLTAGPTSVSRSSLQLLAVGGILYVVGQLAEPVGRRTLAHPRAAGIWRTLVVAGNVLLPALMSAAAVRALQSPED